MKVSDLIREFCEIHSDKYSVYENYSGRFMFGAKCMGIIDHDNAVRFFQNGLDAITLSSTEQIQGIQILILRELILYKRV